MSTANALSDAKPYLRDFFTEQRRQLCEDKQHKDALDREIQARLLFSREYRDAGTVLLYMARPHEIDTKMIFYAALANHKTVGFPVCTDDNRMIFRRVDSLNNFEKGRYGIFEPKDDCEEIALDTDTLCVCPALSCDMRGYRLGFGGGYYDRYLSGFPGVKAALCYASGIIPTIRSEAFDIKMDVIHTDSFTRYMK